MKTLADIKSSHKALKNHQVEISFWLGSSNVKANQIKQEITVILDKLAKFCIEKEASVITELDTAFQQQDASKIQQSATRMKTGVDRK